MFSLGRSRIGISPAYRDASNFKRFYATAKQKKINDLFLDIQKKINQAYVNSGYRYLDSSPVLEGRIKPSIKALFDSQRTLVGTTENNGNKEIYNEYVIQLPENTKLLLDCGYKVEGNLMLELLSDLFRKRLICKDSPSSLPLLAKHVEEKDLSQVDERGWTMLHWAVLGRNLPVAEELLNRGIASDVKDKIGLSAEHLSYWTMDRLIIKLLKPNLNPVDILSDISISSFAEITQKVTIVGKDYKVFSPCLHGWMEEAFPDLLTLLSLGNLSHAEKRHLVLYKPTDYCPVRQESKNHRFSPMALAIVDRNLHQVKDLLSQGWNDETENISGRKRWSDHREVTTGFKYGISGLYRLGNSEERLFCERVAWAVIDSPMSGFTEKDWEEIKRQALIPFDCNINPY
jgi:ankyrin repeat protein